MAELFGCLAFCLAVAIVSTIVYKISTSQKRVAALFKAFLDDTTPSPHSDRLWAEFDRTEADR